MFQIEKASCDDLALLSAYDRHISRDVMAGLIASGQVFVAKEDAAFAGWLRYNLFWDEIPFMNMLFVLEPYRGKGCGQKLVQAWESDMREKGFPGVMTSTMSQEQAQHFYRKLGYHDIGGFFPIGDDAYELIFAKEFLLE